MKTTRFSHTPLSSLGVSWNNREPLFLPYSCLLCTWNQEDCGCNHCPELPSQNSEKVREAVDNKQDLNWVSSPKKEVCVRHKGKKVMMILKLAVFRWVIFIWMYSLCLLFRKRIVCQILMQWNVKRERVELMIKYSWLRLRGVLFFGLFCILPKSDTKPHEFQVLVDDFTWVNRTVTLLS